MRIKIIPTAASLLLLMASSLSHATVTLYGVIDTGIGYDQNKGNSSYSQNRTDATRFKVSRIGLNNGVHFGNRWGLRGTEDLGNGLRANFMLENGFDVRTGQATQGGRLFGRQATLGLSDDNWGQIDLGLKNNMATEYFSMAHPLGSGSGIVGFGSTFSVANTVRYDNQIQYQTPTIHGVQFGIGYSFNINGEQHWDARQPDGTNTKDDNIRAVTTGLRYNQGPLSAALIYDQLHINTRVGGGASPDVEKTRVSAWAAAASYSFDVVKVFMGVGQTRDGLFATHVFGINHVSSALPSFAALPGLRINSYSLGATIPLAGGRFSLGWTMADPRNLPESITGANATAKRQQVYSLGYNYDLSKRTMVYVYAGYARHQTFLPDARATQLNVAFNHKF
ncbi:porin [Paenalcaligenes niemegkensis]|uniref:porin n=1 Tax=Paenalcaligenes niemegkensis TaxID=2895469 RepID=UPI001EE92177|nr:porin [Paenalcaligenes niemegkensis]MCQ9617689.1 porin [Paenalcaligenes niemegkensis]